MTAQQPHLAYPKYRPDIDGLRAFAVLTVVAFHAFPGWVKGGFIGVDVFFVISGYLISTIIFENLDRGTFSFSEFYVRRIKRIFPALFLVLLTCCIFGWFGLLDNEYKQLGKHIAAGSSFISNIVSWNEAGYFDNAADTKPLLHLWSLGIEEQFYIFWPPLVWLGWKQKFNLLKITILIGFVSLILNIKGISQDAVATFYSPATRFWELLAGSILSYSILYKHILPENFSSTKSNIIAILGFMIITCSTFILSKDYSFPGWLAILPVLGTLLIISAGNKSIINSKILSNKFAVWIGLISFPLYLWHWPLLSFARLVVGVTPGRTIRIVVVLASVLLAWLTYISLERHIRFAKGNKYVLMLLLFGFSTAGFGVYIFANDGLIKRDAVQNSGFNAAVREQFVGPLWKYTNNSACLNEYLFKDSDKLAWWFCMKSDNHKPTLIILGNSHANQLYPGFVNNNNLKHHSILSIGTCDFAGTENYDGDRNSPCFGKRITEQAKFIENIIQNNNSIKFAIIDGLNRSPDSAYITRLQKNITNYESKGVQVILFTPHIMPGFDTKACFTTPLRRKAKDCSFPLSDRKKLYADFKSVIESLKQTNPKTLVFEQNAIFCEKNKCSYIRNGMPLHRDEGHTSEYESIEIHYYFTEWAKIHAPQLFDITATDN